VFNGRYVQGQWSSVRRGLAFLRESDAERSLLGLVDVPGVASETLAVLLGSRALYSVPVHQGRAGHPVALSNEAVQRLLSDRASPHLRAALERLGPAERLE